MSRGTGQPSQNAGRESDDDGKDGREQRNTAGHGQTEREFLGHRLLSDEGNAEVASHRRRQPAQVLSRQRRIEAEMLLDPRLGLGGWMRAQEHVGIAAGQRMNGGKYDERNKEQRNGCAAEPLRKQCNHKFISVLSGQSGKLGDVPQRVVVALVGLDCCRNPV